jgi:hypothetical protein
MKRLLQLGSKKKDCIDLFKLGLRYITRNPSTTVLVLLIYIIPYLPPKWQHTSQRAMQVISNNIIPPISTGMIKGQKRKLVMPEQTYLSTNVPHELILYLEPSKHTYTRTTGSNSTSHRSTNRLGRLDPRGFFSTSFRRCYLSLGIWSDRYKTPQTEHHPLAGTARHQS